MGKLTLQSVVPTLHLQSVIPSVRIKTVSPSVAHLRLVSTLAGPQGVSGIGDKYDVAFSLTGKPLVGELLFAHVFASEVTFPAGLTGSLSILGTATTDEAIFSLTKNGVEFATLTFAAAGTSGTFVAASETVFEDGDILRLFAPDPQDATLSNFMMTLTGDR